MRNLRVFIEDLKANNHLAEVTEGTDLMLEASALTAASYKNAGPALHFTSIKDYPEWSLAGGLFTGAGTLWPAERMYWHRIAIAMGLSSTIGYPALMSSMMERMTHPILPVEVDSGPVKSVITKGDQVSLASLPLPLLHAGDGGRYGTLCTLMAKDLDTDWMVWQNVRAMVADDKQLAIPMPEGSALARLYAKYKAADRPMPCCISIGGPPLVTAVGALPLAQGASPAAVAGGLDLDPVELIKAEQSALLVPAQAEMVIEGEISGTLLEGPFPEYWYYTDKSFAPAMKVTAVTRRNDPIIPFSVDGVKPSDTHVLQSVMLSFELFRRIVKIRNNPVLWVQLPIEFNLNVAVVCAPMIFPGLPAWLAKFVMSQSKSLGSLINKVVVVDQRTASVSLEDIINDIILRAHPNRAYHFVDSMPIGPNARYASDAQNASGSTSGVYIDVSWPFEWAKDEIPRKISIEGSYPKELLDKVVANYNKLGFKAKPVIFDEAVVPF